MTSPRTRVLRVTGLPREMALRAIDSLLGGERAVLAIDAVEPEPESPELHAVHVVTEEQAVERVRHKLATGFAPIDIEDVTDTNAAGRAPSLRIRAAVRATPPQVAVDTRPGAARRQTKRPPRSS